MITPDIGQKYLIEFAGTICPGSVVYVDVHPHPLARYRHCEQNVNLIAQKYGGAAVYGWHITEWPNVYLSAMHHVIWKSPKEDFVDPTPHTMGFKKIAYLRDERVASNFGHESIDSAIASDSEVAEFLSLARQGNEEIIRTDSIDPQLQRRLQELVAWMERKYGKEPRGGPFFERN